MVFIETNKENSNYLSIRRSDIGMILLNSENIPDNISKIVSIMYSHMPTFEKRVTNSYISQICIRKDSELGKYLLNTSDIDVIYEDENVSYEKVVNAFNIAIYEDDFIFDQIYPLFKNQISGKRDELITKYGKDTIDYILSNPNFQEYLDKKNEYYAFSIQNSKNYIVYENDEYKVKKLASNTSNQIIKVKK